MRDVSSFDLQLFGIGSSEAEMMDPQQRLLLLCAASAMQVCIRIIMASIYNLLLTATGLNAETVYLSCILILQSSGRFSQEDDQHSLSSFGMKSTSVYVGVSKIDYTDLLAVSQGARGGCCWLSLPCLHHVSSCSSWKNSS